jgi:protein-disulfide isomerase
MNKIKNILKSLFTFNKILVLITLLSIGYLVFANLGKNDTTKITPSLSQSDSQILPNEYVFGNKNAKVVIIEYHDFECPACAQFETIIKPMLDMHGDKVAFVKRNFPLHTKSTPAALAVEAAGLQGKFVEMKDLLYSDREWAAVRVSQEAAINNFKKFATTLGLDVKKFEQDMSSQALKDKVQRDVESALRSNINSTPTFLINGKHIDNASVITVQGWASVIDQAIKESQQTLNK